MCEIMQALLLLNYIVSFYVIFHHISQNLSVLREQLAFVEDEDVQAMHDAIYSKYIMFKYVIYFFFEKKNTIWFLMISIMIKVRNLGIKS